MDIFSFLEDGADGIGDVDPFISVAFGESLDEFMLEIGLVVETCGMEKDIEHDAGIAEGMK